MIGRATASLQPAPRRWVQRAWGDAEVHARLKWRSVWPHLADLPAAAAVLDAGCAEGAWTLELAARRPGWQLLGLDRSAGDVAAAGRRAERLGLGNARFACADFFAYEPARPFDLVLSVASAHYAAELGRGDELFARFAGWLRPGGRLVVFVPRCGAEVPRVGWLPPPFELRPLFDAATLRAAVAAGGLELVTLRPAIGPLGTLAKQVRRAADGSRALAAATYPLQVALSAADGATQPWRTDGPSAGLVVVARRPVPPTAAGGAA